MTAKVIGVLKSDLQFGLTESQVMEPLSCDQLHLTAQLLIARWALEVGSADVAALSSASAMETSIGGSFSSAISPLRGTSKLSSANG